MHLLLYTLVFLLLNFVHCTQLEPGSLCAGKEATSEPVIDYCNSQNGSLILRCCFLHDKLSFVAIDLMDFNFTQVPDFTQIKNYNLSVIDLRSNPELEPSSDNDFLTLTYLDDLLLPENFSCPGGANVWAEMTQTTKPKGNRCMHQKNFCLNLTDKCVEKGSYCSTNGPNHFLCLCENGYYGYKCLRNGKFPAAGFFASTLSITVIASAILYWTQRRHVK